MMHYFLEQQIDNSLNSLFSSKCNNLLNDLQDADGVIHYGTIVVGHTGRPADFGHAGGFL